MDPFTVALTPAGHLVLRPAEPEAPGLEPAAARRIHAAFARSPAAGLLRLGAAEARTELPPTLAFWRDFGRGRRSNPPDLRVGLTRGGAGCAGRRSATPVSAPLRRG